MAPPSPGRNDPCPCGSGKKYKHCCLGKESGSAITPELKRQIEEAMAANQPASLKDAQKIASQIMARFNATAPDDFHGLSPADMSDLLYRPFNSPRLVEFPAVLREDPDAPAMTLFRLLVDAIGGNGVKATAKGNLPQKLVRDVAEQFRDDPWDKDLLMFGINRETDFSDLHIIRIVSTLAGLIRLFKGKFLLTQKCEQLLAGDGAKAIYPLLMQTHATRFNWAYLGWEEMPGIQHTFMFTLYLLNLYGGTFRPAAFYEDAFMKAFPMVKGEADRNPYSSPEEITATHYTILTLRKFAGLYGLATLRHVEESEPWSDLEVMATPLLADAVRFRRVRH